MSGSFFKHDQISIRPPHHLYLDIHTNTRVIEDIPNRGTLRDHLSLNKGLPDSTATTIGQGLGRWLSEFHACDWSHIDEEGTAVLNRNTTALAALKMPFEYTMSVFQEDPLARESILTVFSKGYSDRISIIHGDFTTRKYVTSICSIGCL